MANYIEICQKVKSRKFPVVSEFYRISNNGNNNLDIN
jgi:hypothetical protein